LADLVAVEDNSNSAVIKPCSEPGCSGTGLIIHVKVLNPFDCPRIQPVVNVAAQAMRLVISLSGLGWALPLDLAAKMSEFSASRFHWEFKDSESNMDC
jgi:hypothetical protein